MARDDLLHGPMLKIERAEQHIAELNRQVDAFLAQRPYRWVATFDPEALRRTYATKTYVPMPNDFALIIGDAVHNLRSSLDLLVFALVADKATNPDKVQFPFGKSAERLQSTIDSRQVSLAGEKVVQAIHDIQPYPGGHFGMHELHQLDITDKHKLITPIALAAEMSAKDIAKFLPVKPADLRVIMDEGTVFHVDITPANEADKRLYQMLPAYTEEETDVQPAFGICFADGQPFAHEHVVAKLILLAGLTKMAVNTIAKAAD